jgi:hypothetical protein
MRFVQDLSTRFNAVEVSPDIEAEKGSVPSIDTKGKGIKSSQCRARCASKIKIEPDEQNEFKLE